MIRLYKFKAKANGLRGRYLCKDGESQWISKRDADQAIACGTTIAVRCTGEAAPYLAIMEYDPSGRNMVGAENTCIGKWSPPRGYRIISSNEYEKRYNGGKPEATPGVGTSQEQPLPEPPPTVVPVDPQESLFGNDLAALDARTSRISVTKRGLKE